jgi:hypothetical protein
MRPHSHNSHSQGWLCSVRSVLNARRFLASLRFTIGALFAVLIQGSDAAWQYIFEVLCALIRFTARTLIRIQQSHFSTVGARQDSYWQTRGPPPSNRSEGRHQHWSGWKLLCIVAMGAFLATFGSGWALLNLYSALHRKEIEASDRAALDAIVKQITAFQSDGDQN